MEPAFAPDTPDTDLQDEVARLSTLAQERLERIDTLHRHIREIQRRAAALRYHIRHDGDLISDKALAIAEKHGFCEVWDEFYTDLNDQLQVIELKERVQTHKFKVRIKATYYMYHNVEVTAPGGYAKVRDMLADDADSHLDADDVMRDAVRNGAESDCEYEIEVVED